VSQIALNISGILKADNQLASNGMGNSVFSKTTTTEKTKTTKTV